MPARAIGPHRGASPFYPRQNSPLRLVEMVVKDLGRELGVMPKQMADGMSLPLVVMGVGCQLQLVISLRLPKSGKSSIAFALEYRLAAEMGRAVHVLDGSLLRQDLNRDLNNSGLGACRTAIRPTCESADGLANPKAKVKLNTPTITAPTAAVPSALTTSIIIIMLMPTTRILAVIPARGGSKGIADKNIVAVGGKPLIAWSIETALAAQCAGVLDRVIVSTDSPKIADVARQWGADVPFMRPAELAKDDTPGIDPVIHALDTLQTQTGYTADFVMLLQPTSPLRNGADIAAATAILAQPATDGVVSVTPAAKHPAWCKRIDAAGYLADFLPTEEGKRYTRRQDLPPTLALNGAIYLTAVKTVAAAHSFFSAHTRPYIMPPERSLDVDSPFDLHLVDLLLRHPLAPSTPTSPQTSDDDNDRRERQR